MHFKAARNFGPLLILFYHTPRLMYLKMTKLSLFEVKSGNSSNYRQNKKSPNKFKIKKP